MCVVAGDEARVSGCILLVCGLSLAARAAALRLHVGHANDQALPKGASSTGDRVERDGNILRVKEAIELRAAIATRSRLTQ